VSSAAAATPRPKSKRWQRVRRVALALGAAFALLIVVVVIDGWTAFGHRAEGQRLARMMRSPQWRDGGFVNPQPLRNDWLVSLTGLFEASDHVSPDGPIPTTRIAPSYFRTAPRDGLRVTWFGHSSMLIEIDGERVLTDPVWSERSSPFDWIGPRRWAPPAIALDALPHIDAVVISHDHYDHLDHRTIIAMKDWDTKFIVPLGVGAHLEYWGVPQHDIIELDWWERTQLGELEIVCTPARHASGRHVFDKDAKLWASYSLIGPEHRAFFSGDTGLFPAMRDIGERLGPFDVTMIETGQYHRAWPDWHIGPEQAVRAHGLLRGRTMLPVHWGLFGLAYHGWTEPVERSLVAARQADATITTPKIGQSFVPAGPLPEARWWPQVPWQTAAQHPIRSSQMD